MPRRARYPSDLTDAAWALAAPLVPAPANDGRTPKHRPATWSMRSCMWRERGARGGRCQRRSRPGRRSTSSFARWHDAGVTRTLHDVLRGQVRAAAGRNAEPTARTIDAPSVKGADTVGRSSRGYDAGKKAAGRQRFGVTDTLGLVLVVMVCSAAVQDRDGARTTLLTLYLRHRRSRHIFADGGFAGALLAWATTLLKITVEVVRKPAGQRGFQVLPRRWVVERTLARLTAHRWLACDDERHPAHSEAFIYWAMIGTMTRRLARGQPATRPGLRPLQRTTA